MTTIIATRDVLQPLAEQNLRIADMAATVGVTERTVYRALNRCGLREKNPHRRLTDQERARVVQLRGEGLPATWIAEDIGFGPEAVRRVIPADPVAVAEWLAVWQVIRRTPELLALHREVAP